MLEDESRTLWGDLRHPVRAQITDDVLGVAPLLQVLHALLGP